MLVDPALVPLALMPSRAYCSVQGSVTRVTQSESHIGKELVVELKAAHNPESTSAPGRWPHSSHSSTSRMNLLYLLG